MRRLQIIALAAIIIAGLGYFWPRGSSVTSDDVITLLRTQNPQLSTADMSLVGCQFSIGFQTQMPETDRMSINEFHADLALFELNTIRMSNPTTGVVVTIDRKPISDTLIKQVRKVTDLLPSLDATDQASQGEQSEDSTSADTPPNRITDTQIRDVLVQPNGTLKFSVSSAITPNDADEKTDLKPHADAPAFYAFANSVINLEAPKTAAIGLFFQGDTAAPDTLLSGSIVIPLSLQFVSQDLEAAKQMGQVLFDYKTQHCVS
ncbi:MAG: hypothetical protein ABJL99_17345 [Aliishimia sp.]